MRLFRRVSDIISANLNDLVDSFEEPEVMLRQAIREMESSVGDVTAAAAQAIASETLLARELAEHEQQAARWQARAENAVSALDDDLARRALARKRDHETLARALRDQFASAQDASQTLRRQVNAMRAKLAEARRKLATLSARKNAADARKQFSRFATGPFAQPSGFSRFAQLQDRVALAEAEANALLELHQAPTDDPDAEFASSE
jgi:phage shock protein A